MGQGKQDQEATALFGEAYSAIPKSVFASAAYHLARQLHGDSHADALAGLRQEILALAANGVVTEAQGKRADSALVAPAVLAHLRNDEAPAVSPDCE